MKNYVQPGNTVTLIAPTGGVKSGEPILVGSIFGIAACDAAQTTEVEASLVGVFDLNAVGPINAGAPAYWDVTAKKITATAATNKLVGATLGAIGGGGVTARVRLNGIAIA
jgi:predicted RecA/RadA family phage recombinase